MIIHAIPRFIRPVYGAGNWKAVESNKLALSLTRKAFEIVEFSETDSVELLECCGRDVEHLIIEYSLWIELLEKIRKRAPWINLHVRTHNAQGLQHWHRVHPKFWPTYENVRSLYGVLRLTWRDSCCRKMANTLLGISDWDNKNYWRYLPGRAVVKLLPYYSPWPYLRPEVEILPWKDRKSVVLCMPGARDRISNRMIYGFDKLADRFSENLSGQQWKFLLTQGVLSGGECTHVSPKVQLLQDLKEPWDLMCRIRAVAVLTPLGFGMKTTIIDALAAGCHVLVHPVLSRRLSSHIRELCIVYNPFEKNDISRIIERLKEPPLIQNFNDQLKQDVVNTFIQILT